MVNLKLYNKLKAKINSLKTNKFVERTINFLNKDNFKKLKLILSIFITFILSILIEKFIYPAIFDFITAPINKRTGTDNFQIIGISKTRIILMWSALYFIFLHFILKLDEMYKFIYKYRYALAGAFLCLVMVTKINGSSMTWYTTTFENTEESSSHEIFGISRFIRSDEYATQSMYILSQMEGANKFEYFSNKLRGTTTDMFTMVNAPVKDVLMLGRPFEIGFLVFGKEAGFSFYWYVRIIAMLLGSFELCMILTDKNKKISFIGMIAITFSAAVQWWYCMDCLIWGQIILVLVNKFLETKNDYVKIFTCVGILISALSYIFILYPAWQISFAYVFLALFIWIIIKNYKDYKITKFDIGLIVLTIISILLLLLRWYSLSHDTIKAIMSTKYPGNRASVGGEPQNIFSYFYSILFPYFYFSNPCEYSNMLSYFPIPIILALVYMIKNNKKDIFLIISLVVSAFFGIYCFIGFPEFLSKLTLMSMSIAKRTEIALRNN